MSLESVSGRHNYTSTVFTDTDIKRFFYKLFAYLGNVSPDFDYCFVGGAFVFEDNYGHLFNLLAYNRLNLSKRECSEIGSVPFADGVSMMHTLSHRSFAKKSRKPNCTRKSPSIQIPSCMKDPHLCNKYQRVMHFKNMCNVCNTYENPGYIEEKKIALFYPFELDSSYPNYKTKQCASPSKKTLKSKSPLSNSLRSKCGSKPRRYLYVKFEAEPVISVGHLTAAIDTYITKTKQNKDNKLFETRREEKPLQSHLKLKDDAFYVNRMDEGTSKMDSYEYYNKNVRAGSEFFVSGDLLNMFFDIYLNNEYVSSVCNKIKRNRSVKKQRSKEK